MEREGEAGEVRRSNERGNIIATLERADGPMSPSEISDVTGMKNGNVRRLLFFYGQVGRSEEMRTGALRLRRFSPQRDPPLMMPVTSVTT